MDIQPPHGKVLNQLLEVERDLSFPLRAPISCAVTFLLETSTGFQIDDLSFQNGKDRESIPRCTMAMKHLHGGAPMPVGTCYPH